MAVVADSFERVLGLQKRRPFTPFTIVKTNGERLEVGGPHRLATDGQLIIVIDNEGSIQRLSVTDIREVEEEQFALPPEQERIRERLQSFLTRRPFLPFVIRMKDGSRHEIVRELQAAIGLSTALWVSPDERNRWVYPIEAIQSIEEAEGK